MGWGQIWPARKIISSVTPDFLFLFLKGIIIAHEIKNTFLRCSTSDFLYIVYSKNKFQFSTNCQNVLCCILSQLGLTNKIAYFLDGLRSYAIIWFKHILFARTVDIIKQMLTILKLQRLKWKQHAYRIPFLITNNIL